MKLTSSKVTLSLALLLATALAAQAADGMTTYTGRPGSKMRMEGTSTIHDWQVEGKIISGTLEVGPNFPVDPSKAKPGKVDAKATVNVPVRSMKSVKADGTPYSAAMDDIMYGKLLEATSKAIKFVLGDIEVKEAPKAAGEPVLIDAKGDLTAAGQTKPVTLAVKMTAMPDGKLQFSGTTSIKMTDFGITPPNPPGIETGDAVKLVFDWVVAKKP